MAPTLPQPQSTPSVQAASAPAGVGRRVVHPTAVMITQVCAGMILALLSIRFWMYAAWEIPQILHIRPERLTWNGVAMSPLTLLAKIDERHPDTLGKQGNMIIDGTDHLRTLPIRGNTPALKELIVNYNPIASIPDDIGFQSGLESLFITNGRLTKLPDTVGNLTNLKYLNLYGNRLKEIPNSIGNLTNLEVLDLSYNELESLPPGIANLANVQVLNLAGNKFREFPKSLPAGVKLIFLGGNPLPLEIIRTMTVPYADDIYY